MIFLLVTTAVIILGINLVGLGMLLMESVENDVDRAIAQRYGRR